MNIKIGKTVSSMRTTKSIQVDVAQLWQVLADANPELSQKRPRNLRLGKVSKDVYLGSGNYADTVIVEWDE